MIQKTHYKNGQKIYEQKGDVLTYFFQTGIIKARGKSVQGVMKGKWIFNRENGQLWQVGHFKNGKKDGLWIRYNKVCELEYKTMFKEGKAVQFPQDTGVFAGIGKPAERALKGAGYTSFKQLARTTQEKILGLHGMGPKAAGILMRRLKKEGLSFKK